MCCSFKVSIIALQELQRSSGIFGLYQFMAVQLDLKVFIIITSKKILLQEKSLLLSMLNYHSGFVFNYYNV